MEINQLICNTKQLIVFFIMETLALNELKRVILLDFYDDEDEDSPGLPTKNDEEFKPFIRKLPEFKFWWVYLFFFH